MKLSRKELNSCANKELMESDRALGDLPFTDWFKMKQEAKKIRLKMQVFLKESNGRKSLHRKSKQQRSLR